MEFLVCEEHPNVHFILKQNKNECQNIQYSMECMVYFLNRCNNR